MFFSTLSLMFSAMTCTFAQGVGFEGGYTQEGVAHRYDLDDRFTLSDVSTPTSLVHISITGTEYTLDENNQTITTSTTYNNFLDLSYRYYETTNHSGYFHLIVSSQYANRVAPSMYIKYSFTFYDTDNRVWLDDYTGYIDTLSSLNGENWPYAIETPDRYDDYLETYVTFQFYLISTMNDDPVLDINHTDDYMSGYNDGYSVGYDDGSTDATETAYNDGYDTGYQDGYTSGQNSGYTSGYNTALNTHNFSFTNLFASIADTPILMIRRLFGFELFGTGLISVFMSLFTALIVVLIFKRIIH